MMASDIPAEKRRLRRSLRPLLAQVTPSQALAAGAAIAEHLVRSDIWQVSSRVVLFAARADEVDMTGLQRLALADSKPVLLPRVSASESLEFAALGDQERLQEGRFGILEPPPDAPRLPLRPDDLVLVPGLAFDRSGGRLGRGRGYYDRALALDLDAERRPLLIGVGFSFQIVERVPMTALDVRMDGVVSELGLVETNGSRQWWTRNRRG